MRRLPWKLALSIATALGSGVAAQVPSIGVNFVGGNDNTEIDASEVLPTDTAGVVLQSNWNNVAPWSNGMSKGNGTPPDETGTAVNLINSFGDSTTVDISWDAENTFATDNNVIDNGHERLMHGYLDNSLDRPTIDIDLSEIPYASYDVIVYVGSDGNNRAGAVRLNEDPTTDTFYLTFTGSGFFTGPSDYVQATTPFEALAVQSNYVVYEEVSGSSLRIQNVRGSTNSGIHGLQIVQRAARSILEIDTTTGLGRILGGDVLSVDINGIELTSEMGSLRPDSYTSLSQRLDDAVDTPLDPDGLAGSSPGENWETVFASNDSIIEGFLLGSTTLNTSVELPLGAVYDPSVGIDDTLTFQYTLATGQIREGEVVFVTSTVDADFDDNGLVGGRDFLVWQRGYPLPTGAANSDGDANEDGAVDAVDLTLWQQRYGTAQLSSSAAATIPEPGSAIMTLCGLAGALASDLVSQRRLRP